MGLHVKHPRKRVPIFRFCDASGRHPIPPQQIAENDRNFLIYETRLNPALSPRLELRAQVQEFKNLPRGDLRHLRSTSRIKPDSLFTPNGSSHHSPGQGPGSHKPQDSKPSKRDTSAAPAPSSVQNAPTSFSLGTPAHQLAMAKSIPNS